MEAGSQENCIRQRDTHYFQALLPVLVRRAWRGWKVLLGSLLCSLSSGPHRSHASALGSSEAHSGQRKNKTKKGQSCYHNMIEICRLLQIRAFDLVQHIYIREQNGPVVKESIIHSMLSNLKGTYF